MARHKPAILTIVVLVATMICLATLGDGGSIADTSSDDDVVTTNPGKASNSSASATISITLTTATVLMNNSLGWKGAGYAGRRST